ncbi:MAG TPA: nucleotide exchange factor GrpE [Desulfobacteraceae bacterium]|nr:nucleotide exchange factor GrpE [Desulfobacteraceae bacterium]
MVKVDITAEEKMDEKARENSDEQLEALPVQGDKNQEIPLEKMTNEQLLEKVNEFKNLADKNYDLYIRSQADIDNLKKRYKKDKEELVKFSNESLIRQLLVGIDSLEKAIEHSKDDNTNNALREGIELTLKSLMDTLKKAGLEEVKAMGEPFDPNFHEAVLEQEDSSVNPGTVINEFQKGYILNQRLLRPATVIVSRNRE